MKKAVIILSGGADSSTLLYHIKNIGFEKIYALSFNYNQKHRIELECAEYHCKNIGVLEHRIVKMQFLDDLVTNSALTNKTIAIPNMKEVCGHPQLTSYFNNRNMIFLSIAASYAESVGATDIFYGAVGVDEHSYWDCSLLFLQKINELLSLNRLHRITVHAPLVDKSKKEIIQLGLDLGVNFSKTWTCYDPIPVWGEKEYFCGLEPCIVSYKSCSKCPSCSARIKGFIDAGVKDPLEYNIVIDWAKYGIS